MEKILSVLERESLLTDLATALRTVDIAKLEKIEGFESLIKAVAKFGTPAGSLPNVLAAIADMITGVTKG